MEPSEQQTRSEPSEESLARIVEALIGKRREAIDGRAASGVEARWRDDLAAYNGNDNLSPANIVEQANQAAASSGRGAGRDQQPRRATVFVQITRQKTNAAAARLGDMLYPTDDRNWELRPTPVADLSSILQTMPDEPIPGPDGQPLQHPDQARPLVVRDIVEEKQKLAREKARRMQTEIDDLLVEADYNAHGRRVILDAALIGTGIIKGPSIVTRVRRAWVQDPTGEWAQEVKSEDRPASTRVPVWNVYVDPSCGDNHQQGSYIWEVELMGARRLRALAQSAGYDRAAIADALREGPQNARHNTFEWISPNGRTPAALDKLWEVWTYVGELTLEEVGRLGSKRARKKIAEEEEDPTKSVQAIVVMVNNRPIRAVLDPLDVGDFGYDFFRWERIDESPYGAGIPHLMRYAQRTINAAWRAMLDNMASSYGPILFINREALRPVDGDWTLTGRKIFEQTDPSIKLEEAFRLIEIPSGQEALQRIIELGMRFADEETALPMIAQGERGTAPDTATAFTILMNSANTVLRRIVKEYDDNITRPHIRRYYDWLMRFSDKNEIKGDFSVDARGSTALVVREGQKQDLAELMNLARDPEYKVYFDVQSLVRRYIESKRLPPDVMRTREEIAVEQSKQREPAPLPMVQVAQIRANAEVEKTKIDTESERQNQELRAAQAREERAARIYEMQLEERKMLLEYALKNNLDLSSVKAQLADTIIKTQSNERIKAADLAARGKTAEADRRFNQVEQLHGDS